MFLFLFFFPFFCLFFSLLGFSSFIVGERERTFSLCVFVFFFNMGTEMGERVDSKEVFGMGEEGV